MPNRAVELTDASKFTLNPCRPEFRSAMLQSTFSPGASDVVMFTPVSMPTLEKRE